MKKLIMTLSGLMLISAFIFTSCQQNQNPAYTETKVDVYTIDAATTTAQEGHSWNIASISLQDFANKTINITFSADMKVTNTGDSANLVWKITATKDGKDDFPTIASQTFAKGTSEWTTVTGSGEGILLNNNPVLYIDTYGVTPADLTIQVKNIAAKVTVVGETDETTLTEIKVETGVTKESIVEDKSETPTNWLSSSVPSLYETYKDQFDSIGLAAEYGNFGLSQNGSNKYTATYTHDGFWGKPVELYYEEVRNGIKKHANSITLGNELKPGFILQWWDGDGSKQETVDFVASNGRTIKVPSSLNGEKLIYATLNACKDMGIRMRGHVLTWHSQTPDGFFAENYKPEYNGQLISNLVDKETMTARHEWYIKSVLECVANWEAANGYGTGNHIIWAWDVVNEACADDATSGHWYRGDSSSESYNQEPSKGGSRWYQLYGSNEFIVNAFRFANAYAPSDVILCYNDYNEYWDAEGHLKTTAIETLVKAVQKGTEETVNGSSVKPRIDVVAMQSHVGTSWPGTSGYEAALKRFLALGCDVHVSELDFSAETQEDAKKAYGEYFKMLQKYGKNYSGTNKVTNVTIWGINNETSWINPASDGGIKTYPLLFNLDNKVDGNTKEVIYNTGAETLPMYDIGDTYVTNPAFWAVINAHN